MIIFYLKIYWEDFTADVEILSIDVLKKNVPLAELQGPIRVSEDDDEVVFFCSLIYISLNKTIFCSMTFPQRRGDWEIFIFFFLISGFHGMMLVKRTITVKLAGLTNILKID